MFRRSLVGIAAPFLLAVCAAKASAAADPFVVKPYLQLGERSAPGELALVWHAADRDEEWRVETSGQGANSWKRAEITSAKTAALEGAASRRVRVARLVAEPGTDRLLYRLSLGGKVVFEGSATPPRPRGKPFRFVAFGDCGAGTQEERAIAYQAYQIHPDFVFITGDIIYDRGRLSEYHDRFWPVYQAPTASPRSGAPFLQSTLFVAAAGNHDIANRNLDRFPDGLAYFYNWVQPLNGPIDLETGKPFPALEGSAEHRRAFSTAAGAAYPVMANFSFDYGDSHWVVLDSNPYIDPTDPKLVDWILRDFAQARTAAWKFVAFHHPGFNSSRKHFEQQQMRLLAPTLERAGVNLVFSGHVHNYQRTYPLRFKPERDSAGRPIRSGDRAPGEWTLDQSYDGRARTVPSGVIYLVTGAGGAHLYDSDQEDDPASWQPFTYKFLSKINSFTVVDVGAKELAIRQIDLQGRERDRFIVSKGE